MAETNGSWIGLFKAKGSSVWKAEGRSSLSDSQSVRGANNAVITNHKHK